MTAAKVVDASAVAALLFLEPGCEAVARAIEDSPCLAPGLLELELASVYLKKVRLDPGSRQALRDKLGLLPGLAIGLREVPWDSALAVAEASGLSIYDAQYLCLAQTLHLELVTLDARLKKARKVL